jgi:hypothetical protein
MLANRVAMSQTGGIMKRVPRIWKASIAAIAVILIIQACAPISLELVPGAYRLVLSAPQQLKKGETAFANALKGLKHPGVSYDFLLVRDDGTTTPFKYTSKIAIKTDRVITTELAKSLSQGEFTPIGSSITHYLNTPTAADIAVVLNQIKK